MLISGAVIARSVGQGGAGVDELVEVPLMGGIFAAMAWHARRRRTVLEELGRTTRERDFIRDASHQLRTPITVARGHAELILETHPRSTVAGDVRVIAAELKHLSAISDRLILLATSEQPGFVEPTDVDIGRLVERTVARWRPVAQRRWRADVNGRRTVLADPERIECALDALIENAVNATGDGDLISVAARTDGNGAVIEVVDQGAGISPAELPYVFDRFSRGRRSGPGPKGGTGLGLPVVKAIAEAHHGSVSVSSVPGRGTSFRLRLNGNADPPGTPP
jgi:signal transduction histidine kinase